GRAREAAAGTAASRRNSRRAKSPRSAAGADAARWPGAPRSARKSCGPWRSLVDVDHRRRIGEHRDQRHAEGVVLALAHQGAVEEARAAQGVQAQEGAGPPVREAARGGQRQARSGRAAGGGVGGTRGGGFLGLHVVVIAVVAAIAEFGADLRAE